ncbi:MAG: hypothetical protein MUF24_01220 [Chitinophagaceae bacterium]|nr:hypothetical protein [Chitinophagaceae bacterium]
MRNLKIGTIYIIGWLCILVGCRKDDFITSADANLIIRADTLFFDTVFTTTGSVTRRFTLVNPNNQKLRISRIALEGSGSAYSLNINGMAANTANNLDLLPQDSLYIFVKVTIDPGSSNLPFLVKDSITINYNGNNRKVQLQAFGRNARFINGGTITANTTWDAALPWVLLRPVRVAAGATLSILAGAQVYSNANAALLINGSLQCLGQPQLPVIFRSDRLDAPFSTYPGGWAGILLDAGSTNNLLQYTHILNAYQALVCAGQPQVSPAKLRLESCIIQNAYDIGLMGINSSIAASNCLIVQAGNNGQPGTGGSNVILAGGGNYSFEHCTIATIANFFQNHRQPVVVMGNTIGGSSAALQVSIKNSIIHGEGGLPENEILINRTAGFPFSVTVENCLIKSKDPVNNATLTNVLLNQAPLFDSINTQRQLYNYRLRSSSPAVNAGAATGLALDLDGLPRRVGTAPDLGSYERQ